MPNQTEERRTRATTPPIEALLASSINMPQPLEYVITLKHMATATPPDPRVVFHISNLQEPMLFEVALYHVVSQAIGGHEAIDDDARWINYVRDMTEQGVNATIARTTGWLWHNMRRSVPQAFPPDASPSEDGTLLLAWSRGSRYLEVEVAQSGEYVWFYRDHNTPENDSGPGVPSQTFSAEFVSRATALFNE